MLLTGRGRSSKASIEPTGAMGKRLKKKKLLAPGVKKKKKVREEVQAARDVGLELF